MFKILFKEEYENIRYQRKIGFPVQQWFTQNGSIQGFICCYNVPKQLLASPQSSDLKLTDNLRYFLERKIRNAINEQKCMDFRSS